ncbi:MAG: hypothetical protein ABR915_23530 [Thermoguttaceae bacterium]
MRGLGMVSAVLVLILFVVGAKSAAAQDATKKMAVPDSNAQAEAMKVVKEVYGDEWSAANTFAEKQAVAKKLLEKADESKGDPAGRFVLLRVARDIAAQAADWQTALRAIEAMADSYKVDANEMKLAVLTELASAAQRPAKHKIVAEEALKLLGQAVREDEFTVAGKLTKLAVDEAEKADAEELVIQARHQVTEVAQMTMAYEDMRAAKAKLETVGNEPNANLVVGTYFCFVKRNWEKGLPMLALGNEEVLKALAKQDLECADSSAERAKLGDAWWSFAETQAEATKEKARERAGYWYKRALPELSGLTKEKVEKRLGMLNEVRAAPVVLRYDWRQGQLDDWKWVGDGKPFANDGLLEFHRDGELLLRRNDIQITDIAMSVQTLDRTQALDVFVGENRYRLHFLNGFIEIGDGAIRPHADVSLDRGWQSLNISIPAAGDTVLTVGGVRVAAPVKKPGAMRIQLECQNRFLIRDIVIKGVKVAGPGMRDFGAAGDLDSARAVQQEVKALTPLTNAKPDRIVGKWIWAGGVEVATFQENGTVNHTDGGTGTWTCVDRKLRRYQVAWKNGHVDRIAVSADGTSAKCRNEANDQYEISRAKE